MTTERYELTIEASAEVIAGEPPPEPEPDDEESE